MYKFKGKEQSPDLFDDYSVKDVLMECDRPLLFIMEPSEPEEHEGKRRYLFNWCCDFSENDDRFHKWMALEISEERIDALINGSISLREAILLHEDDFYIVDVDIENKIVKIISFDPVSLPDELLPKPGVSIYGPDEEPDLEFVQNRLSLGVHLFSEQMARGFYGIPQIAPIESSIQSLITWASHNIISSSELLCFLPTDDWTYLNRKLVKAGSFNTIWESRELEITQLDAMKDTLKYLKDFLRGDVNNTLFKSAEKDLGMNFLIHLYTLLSNLKHYEIGISLKWYLESGTIDIITINKHQAKKLIRPFNRYFARDKSPAIVKVKLSSEEIEMIKRPVEGEGGMQSLNRHLQSKLREDGSIELTPMEIERLIRYCQDYGQGGFQGRFFGVLQALNRMKFSLERIK